MQWLRIHLPMQGTQVQTLVREDPTCRGKTKPVRHNYWAREPQQEKHTATKSGPPLSTTRENLCVAMKTQHSQK